MTKTNERYNEILFNRIKEAFEKGNIKQKKRISDFAEEIVYGEEDLK